MKFILLNRSSTQRLTVTIKKSDVLINKEFRKSKSEDWVVGKGITIPKNDLINLGHNLNVNSMELDKHYEVIGEE